ncbi:MAG: beta-galactosidase [Clostridia bacterium]|nr:beta-galactosidase [Clostridia bacterium]
MVDLRLEYPRPMLVRENWLCLNGQWEFETDTPEVGVYKKYWERESLNGEITVPYCPESVLSGVGHTDFIGCVWYRKTFTLPQTFKGKRCILHFGAVDYLATVYVNGQKAGSHQGGYTPFFFDITDYLAEGENVLTVHAVDHERSGKQPAGKQSRELYSKGCSYTRVTGIWQTVWMEPVEEARVLNYYAYPDVTNGSVTLQVKVTSASMGKQLKVSAAYEGKPMGEAATVVQGDLATVTVPLAEKHLWELGCGRLYDLEFTLGEDHSTGYFGLREVGLDSKGMTLNGEHFFGRWVLDQGYYPDGIYTAPSDAALKKDIEDSMALGFNGARLHQKIFEPRFLYWADKLGYTVWGEHANWGLNTHEFDCLAAFLPEWLEMLERDFSHPSLIGWIPVNETWDNRETGTYQSDAALELVYRTTKAVDPTRPCIDSSGSVHVATDLHDVHDYEQDPEKLASYYDKIAEGIVNCQLMRNVKYNKRVRYMGGPVYVSEYGGIKWTDKKDNAWGYGKSVETEEEFIARYKGLTDVLLDNENIMGFCYTQLYDVEQECNGLLTYERKFKFDPKIFHEINTRKAKIEE